MKNTSAYYGKLKAFRLPENLNERFIRECKNLKVNQKDIIELLIKRWCKMRNIQNKRTAKIYNDEN